QQSKHKEYYYVYMHAPGQELAVSIPLCVCKQLSFLVHLIDPFGFVFAELVLVQSSYATIKERIKPAGVFPADPLDHGLDRTSQFNSKCT
uniref:Uncharacterized protein n=1 Tax=Aegilops tauschii subsp. strangulata TaxID=200361 RepID=A0A453QD17_AEGTS